MFNHYNGPVFVRGKILEKDGNSLILEFLGSSVILDENDLVPQGNQLILTGVSNPNDFAIGETVIAEGNDEAFNTFSTIEVTKNSFQPLGIDWKYTAALGVLLILSLVGLFIYKVGQEMKAQLASAK